MTDPEKTLLMDFDNLICYKFTSSLNNVKLGELDNRGFTTTNLNSCCW